VIHMLSESQSIHPLVTMTTIDDQGPLDQVFVCRQKLSISSLPPRQAEFINYLTVAVDGGRIPRDYEPASATAAAAVTKRESGESKGPRRDVLGLPDVGVTQLAQLVDARLQDSERRRVIIVSDLTTQHTPLPA